MSNAVEFVKKHIVLVLVALVVLGGGGTYIGIKVADMPFFCGMLCHNMQVHVDTYNANFHSKAGVICMDCHCPDQSFMGHLIEHVEASTFMVQNITKPYLEDEHGLHKGVKGFNEHEMNFKDEAKEKEVGEKCMQCHPSRIVLSYFMHVPEEKQDFLNANCRRCHTAITGLADTDATQAKSALYRIKDRPMNLPNVHPLHLGKNVLCTKCHSRVVHSNDPTSHTPAMDYCFRCHDDKKAPRSNCAACHVGIRNILKGEGTKELKGEAAPMGDLNCTDCHTKENLKVDTASCVGCHDDSYVGILKDYQKEYDQKLKELNAMYAQAKEKVSKAQRRGQAMSATIKDYRIAEYNLEYIKLDRSRGLHNHDLINNLIADCQTKFETVQSAL